MSFSKPDAQHPGHGDEHPEERDKVPGHPRPLEESSPGRHEVIGDIHQPTGHHEDEAAPDEVGKIVEDRHRTDWPIPASNEHVS